MRIVAELLGREDSSKPVFFILEVSMNKIVRRSHSEVVHQLVEVDDSGKFVAISDMVIGNENSANKLASLLTNELNHKIMESPVMDKEQQKEVVATLSDIITAYDLGGEIRLVSSINVAREVLHRTSFILNC